MKITTELLKKYSASDESIKFLEDNFNGAGFPLEIIEKYPNLPPSWIHFARMYFLDTPEEVAKYNEICSIKDSTNTLYSADIMNSSVVYYSNEVEHSAYVFHSNLIKNSNFIYIGTNIKNSSNVKDAEDVQDSTLVALSSHIADSTQICDSDYVNWSHQILYSFLINDSSFIYKSKNLNDCYFCGFLTNCKHCLFCYGLEDKQYYIFNKEVSRAQYEKIKEELQFLLYYENPTFMTVEPAMIAPKEERIKYSKRLDSIFNGLSNEFYEWLYKLDGFDDEKFMSLFFKQREEKI